MISRTSLIVCTSSYSPMTLTFFYSHKSLDALFQIINTELKLVADWFRENRLNVNFDKTSYIIFKSYKKARDCFNLGDVCINETNLTQVGSTKLLGVFVHQHLDWKEHINLQATKLFIVTPATKGGGWLPPPLGFRVRFKILYRVIQPLIQHCLLHKMVYLNIIYVIATRNYEFFTTGIFP